VTRADPHEALIRSIASDLKRLAELEELLMRGHAERLGIHVTDVRCLVALADESPSTAGKLGELLGLSTGAVTAMLDRLEKMGLVRREKSTEDRRQVLVTLANAGAHATDASEVWSRTAHRALADVNTADAKRLRAVLDTLIFGLSEEVERVRGATAGAAEKRSALLRITRGGQKITVDGDADYGELVTVRDGRRGAAPRGGADPDVTIKNDVVTVGGPLLPLRKGRDITLSLSESVRWRIEVHGSGSLIECRLQKLDVRSVEIVGGAHKITLHMGAPRDAVPIRLLGGASHLIVLRPRSVATRVVVRDGLSAADLDGKSILAGGIASRESEGFSERRPHYEVEVKGGASQATVGIA
jgi:DNA-binding MarR family transcriptional regulator